MDELHTVTSETNGRLAQRVARPGRRLDVVLWKEHGRDGAIAFPFNPGIDGAQHLAQALTPLRRDAGVRWCRRLAQPAPVASKRFQTVWRRIVQQNESSRGRAGAAAPHQLDADDLIAESNALMADTRRIGL